MNSNKLKIKLFYPPRLCSSWGTSSWITGGRVFYLPIPPYGMGIVTTALRREGYYVEQEDLLINIEFRKKNWERNSVILANKKYVEYCLTRGILEPKLNRLADEILSNVSYNGFDVIGFSISSYLQLLFALLLAEKIKKNTGTIIVFGGPFITSQGQKFFYKYSFLDFMIIGDGEKPFLKLLGFLQGKCKIEEIPGLLYRDNEVAKINPREFYNIDDMPLPDFDGLQLDLYKDASARSGIRNELMLPYQINRGCTHRCSFCAQRGIDKEVDIKSFGKVIEDLKEYSKRYQSNYFLFCDWTVNISYGHMDRLCDLLIENKLNIHWVGLARVDNLDEKLLNKMRESGCTRLMFGVESGSNTILQLMRKDFSVEKASEIIKLTHSAGIKVAVSLMAGFPYETKKDINKTIIFIKGNSKYIDTVFTNIFLLEPNSPISNNPEEFKVENLRSEHGYGHRNYFIFDETYGLKWKQKIRQQKKAYLQILKAIYYNIFTKYLPKPRVHFWVWLFYQKK